MSTYLELVNEVLTQLNEVNLTESNFASARGIHASAKNGVRYAVKKINSQKFEWPFNATSGTQSLTPGQGTYSWPADYKRVDWNSIFVNPPASGSAENTRVAQLEHITSEEYYHWYKANDDSETNAQGVPARVYEQHTGGFGVQPIPDFDYEVTFKYWKKPDDISAYSDEVTIPSEYDYVIILGALSHMKMFKDDLEAFQIADKLFQDGIKDMVGIFLANTDHMRDTRVGF